MDPAQCIDPKFQEIKGLICIGVLMSCRKQKKKTVELKGRPHYLSAENKNAWFKILLHTCIY